MAFLKIRPHNNISRRRSPITFGVGPRMGNGGAKSLEVKLRLQAAALGAPLSDVFIAGTYFDVSYDEVKRMLLIEPGADFKLYRPGGIVTQSAPLLLGFPLPTGVRREKFLAPVTEHHVDENGRALTLLIPAAAFEAPRGVADTRAAPATVPATLAGKKEPYVGVLASVPHNPRRGT